MEVNNGKNITAIENKKLKEAIVAMQDNNCQENVNAMINCLMASKFITPGTMSAPQNVARNDGKGGTVMQQQTQVQFQLIENENKEKFFPAFTDKDEMSRWEPAKGKTEMLMTFDDYAGVLSDPNSEVKGFVVNPFGKSVAFPKQMVMSLKEQKAQMENKKKGGLQKQVFDPNEQLQVGEPADDEYPVDMMAAIINVLNERDDVNKAYLKMFKRESEETESYLVIIDFTGDKMEEIFKAVSIAAYPHQNGRQMSMMPYSLPFAKNAVADTEPFFEAE